jgi:hypothetical protein
MMPKPNIGSTKERSIFLEIPITLSLGSAQVTFPLYADHVGMDETV